jgi:4-amino-4-deoxy-L-arabinose transferase-like glycosyltransferase
MSVTADTWNQPLALRPTWTWRRIAHASLPVHLGIVLAVALILRATCFIVSNVDPVPRQMEEDSYGYVTLASNLLLGNGFARAHAAPGGEASWLPELCRTPGYPVVVAFLQRVTGQPLAATVIAQHVVSIALCGLLTVICRRRFGAPAGLVAGGLLALDFHGVALANMLLTEAFFSPLLFLAALGTARLLVRPSQPLALLTGGIIAASALIKPTTWVLAPILGIGLLILGARRRDRSMVLAAVTLVLAGAVPVAAWINRNGQVAGQYTFSVIPRYQLLEEHATGALARAEHLPLEEARERLVAATGISAQRIRYSALSANEEARVRNVALETIWQNRSAFVVETALRSTNTLFGPDKNLLTVLGLPPLSLHVFGSDDASLSVSPWLSVGLLIAQVLWLGALYALVLRTLLQMVRPRRVPPLVWTCLALAAFVILPSLGAPGEPRYRWPAIPLLIIVGVASLGNTSEAARGRAAVTSVTED